MANNLLNADVPHRLASVAGKLKKTDVCKEFRDELDELQIKLRVYTKMLSEMAGVEDYTVLENQESEEKQ